MGQLELHTGADEHECSYCDKWGRLYCVRATMQKQKAISTLALFLFAAQPLGIRRRAHYAAGLAFKHLNVCAATVSRRVKEGKTLIE